MYSISNLVRTLAVGAVMALAATASQAATFTFDDNGGNGTAVNNGALSGAFDFGITIVSNDNGVGGIFTTATAVADNNYLVEGVWQYSTNDVDGSTWDPFGYFIDDVFVGLVQLTTDDVEAPSFQNGAFSFVVSVGQSFGFYGLSLDGALGSSTGIAYGDLTVAAIPLPAGGLLLLTALGAAAALRRRKTAIAA